MMAEATGNLHRYITILISQCLHRNGASLLEEVKMMSRGRNPHVVHLLGLFKGKLPNSGPLTHLGLVMELMERGSLASLQVERIYLFIYLFCKIGILAFVLKNKNENSDFLKMR